MPDGLTDTSIPEKAVIGAALIDKSAIRFASEHVTEEEFANPRLGAVWAILFRRWKAGEPTDVPSIAQEVAATVRGIGAGDLFDLSMNAPASASAGYLAEQVAEGAKRRRLIEAGTRMVQAAQESDFSDALARAKHDLENVGAARSRKLTARKLTDVLAETDEYDWVIPGLIERRDRLILTGGEGAGKSTLVRQLTILSAAGLHPFDFSAIDPVQVLVVDAENSEKQWRRATRGLVSNVARKAPDVADRIPLACVPRLDITRERDLSAIHDLVDRYEPGILFIGPLYRLVPRAIQSDDDAAPLLAALDSLREKGPALVMEAHAGHTQSSQGQRDLRPRGSSALMGWPEFGIGLRLDTNDPAFQANPRYRKADLTRWRGDRDERAWPLSLFSGNHYPWTTEPYQATSF